MDRKLHVDTLIFIPTWKNNVFIYSRQIGNFCVHWRNTTNSYVIPQKASLWNFLVNTLLLYIPLLTLTDRITDKETHTLASRGLEELLFQLCCCVSFWFWREIVFGFAYILRVQYSCVVVSVFWVWRERVLVWYKKNSYWVSLFYRNNLITKVYFS